jgi:hypothetical protein
MNLATIESAVIPSLTLKVDGKEYTVRFPLSAIIRAEEKIKKSLKYFVEWHELAPSDVPLVLEAGIAENHGDVTAEIAAICERLNPEALYEIRYALCKLSWPRAMADYEAKCAAALAAGKTSPNV